MTLAYLHQSRCLLLCLWPGCTWVWCWLLPAQWSVCRLSSRLSGWLVVLRAGRLARVRHGPHLLHALLRSHIFCSPMPRQAYRDVRAPLFKAQPCTALRAQHRRLLLGCANTPRNLNYIALSRTPPGNHRRALGLLGLSFRLSAPYHGARCRGENISVSLMVWPSMCWTQVTLVTCLRHHGHRNRESALGFVVGSTSLRVRGRAFIEAVRSMT